MLNIDGYLVCKLTRMQSIFRRFANIVKIGQDLNPFYSDTRCSSVKLLLTFARINSVKRVLGKIINDCYVQIDVAGCEFTVNIDKSTLSAIFEFSTCPEP